MYIHYYFVKIFSYNANNQSCGSSTVQLSSVQSSSNLSDAQVRPVVSMLSIAVATKSNESEKQYWPISGG